MSAKETMIVAEGLTLIISFILGGSFLLYYVFTERNRKLKLQEFFAVFNHEIKTYITSLRLKTDELVEESPGNSLAQKIFNDSVRLEIQLENSLFLANPKRSKLYYEEVSVGAIVEGLRLTWTGLDIEMAGELKILGDKRALETILKNLIQNAVIHGMATKVDIQVKGTCLVLGHNGGKFEGELEKLGKLFYRHSASSRSGVGLYLVKQLMKNMGGDLVFSLDNEKLITKLCFKASLDE